MKNVLQSALAIVVGIVSALIVIIAIQSVSNSLFPWPEGVDMSNTQAVANHISTLPVAAFVIVLMSYFIAVIDGVILSTWLAPKAPRAHSAAVFALLAGAALVNILSFPHPTWFVAGVLTVYLSGFAVGDMVGTRMRRKKVAQ